MSLPTLYGDHHVIEVRRILLALSGVESVYASSCFQTLEVTYDPAQIRAEDITARLEEAGYLGDLPVPHETEEPAGSYADQPEFFRHTAAYQQTGRTISFAQNVSYTGRPLWPCPGLGTIKIMEASHGEERT